MVENKPCPFCGGDEISAEYDDGLSWNKCGQCGATGPASTRYSEENTPGWNTRHSLQHSGEPVGLTELGAAYHIVSSAKEHAAPADKVFLASHQKLLGNLIAEIESRTTPQPVVPEGLDFDFIAAVLEDYCFLQTSGIIAPANRYATSDVNEQVALLSAGKGGE